MKKTTYNIMLEEGKAVAFDFDGVIHKYSKGWQDGSIYDEPNKDVLDLMLMLRLMKIPCVIISTRDPKQIKEWWDNQGISPVAKVLDWDTYFYKDCSCIGITNRKIPAQLYVDDRAYRYTGQTAKEFLVDCAEKKGEENVAEKIKAEIEQLPTTICRDTCRLYIYADEFKESVLAILDKYMTKEGDRRDEDKQAGQQQKADID